MDADDFERSDCLAGLLLLLAGLLNLHFRFLRAGIKIRSLLCKECEFSRHGRAPLLEYSELGLKSRQIVLQSLGLTLQLINDAAPRVGLLPEIRLCRCNFGQRLLGLD